jgi:hypothetical protein
MSPFSAPFSGAPRSEGFCFQSEWPLYGREPNGVEGGTGKAEAAKLQDAGIRPEAVPRKMSGRKRDSLLNWLNRAGQEC